MSILNQLLMLVLAQAVDLVLAWLHPQAARRRLDKSRLFFLSLLGT